MHYNWLQITYTALNWLWDHKWELIAYYSLFSFWRYKKQLLWIIAGLWLVNFIGNSIGEHDEKKKIKETNKTK